MECGRSPYVDGNLKGRPALLTVLGASVGVKRNILLTSGMHFFGPDLFFNHRSLLATATLKYLLIFKF
jgi:hypothetical protein